MTRRIGLLSEHINSAHETATRRCLYFDASGKRCKNESIRSHSLQRRGPLKSISEDGHLIKFGRSLATNSITRKEFFERIGVKKASIFHGFCPKHDSEVFSDIEGSRVTLNDRAALLFLIRAQSMEYYRKQVMKQLFSGLMDEESLPQKQLKTDFIRYTIRGCNAALSEGEQKIKYYFSCLHKRIPSTFKFLAFRFSEKIPIAGTGAFEPEYDFNQKFLFLDDPLKLKWNSVGVFAGNINDYSLLFLSGFQKYKGHRIDDFFRSLTQQKEEIPHILITLLCAFSENVYFQESYYKSLPSDDLDRLKTLLRSGVFEGIRDPDVFKLRIPIKELCISEFVAKA